MTYKKLTRTKVKRHPRKTKKGKTTVHRHSRKVKKIVVLISKKERKLFDEITKKKGGKEIAMTKDFAKKKTERNLYVGNGNDIEFPINNDTEFVVHTHPKSDLLAFSADDIKGILSSKNQEAEVVLHNGKALLLEVPNKLNRAKFIKDYCTKMRKLKKKSNKAIRAESSKLLKKHGFKLKKFKQGKEIRMNLEIH